MNYIIAPNRPRKTPREQMRVGHQMKDKMSALILARMFPEVLTYLHVPFFDEGWEAFFDLGKGERLFRSDDVFSESVIVHGDERRDAFHLHSGLARQEVDGYFKGCRKENVLFRLRTLKNPPLRVYLYQLVRWDRSLYSEIVKELREKVGLGPERGTREKRVAVHIRREDASLRNKRYIPLEAYAGVMKGVQDCMRGEDAVFSVFSSGSLKQMKEIEGFIGRGFGDIVFHLNSNPYEAMKDMALSDVLIAGCSSFSDWAGFVSEGIKFYFPHFHMPRGLDAAEWIEYDQGGFFSKKHFEGLLGGCYANKI